MNKTLIPEANPIERIKAREKIIRDFYRDIFAPYAWKRATLSRDAMRAGTSHYPYTSSSHDLLSRCKDKQFFRIFLIFERKSFFISFFLRTFATAICHAGFEVLWGRWSRWVEHYILKGVTDALFLTVRNLGTSEYVIKDKCCGNSTGCSIYSP